MTRLEVSGFKNLIDFSVDFGPYTCIAGKNAVGKSNVFDVIEFLSALADDTFIEAAQRLRSDSSGALANISSLFWRNSDGTYRDMSLAVECIVGQEVTDDFGRQDRAQSTFLRYEIGLKYVPPEVGKYRSPFGSIELMRESLEYITKADVIKHLPWTSGRKAFRDSAIKNNRTVNHFISTRYEDGQSVILVHQEGGSRGKPNTSPASRAPRSVVSTATTIDLPTTLAFRRELQGWKKFALEPMAMRSPDTFTSASSVSSNGAHLPATMFRLQADDGDAIARIQERVNDLVDVRALEVLTDYNRDALTLRANIGSADIDLPARSLSDGTLRFLVLCTMLFDPESRGVVMMEEPENGIHPAKIAEMVRLLRDLAVDPEEEVSVENPLRQVIINTHSPHVVSLQEDSELLEAVAVARRDNSAVVSALRLLPLASSWRKGRGTQFTHSKASIAQYLSYPEDSPQAGMTPGMESMNGGVDSR